MSLDVSLKAIVKTEVYSDNYTHNMGPMAKAAGIYHAIWRPEELGLKTAAELIPILRKGYDELVLFPHLYKKYNPENGWGDYDGFVEFVHKYYEACLKWPNAEIEVSR